MKVIGAKMQQVKWDKSCIYMNTHDVCLMIDLNMFVWMSYS